MLPKPKKMETRVRTEGLPTRGCEGLSVKMEGGDKWISSSIDHFTHLF